MNARNGKIAHLPRAVREELNRRLEAAEESPEILEWLNGLAEVQAMLKEHFQGAAITKQNLSHWRQGGFQEALARRDLAMDVQDLTGLAEELGAESVDAELADNAAIVLAARLGALAANWNGEADEAFERKARIFSSIGKTIVQLQRQMHQSRRETAAAQAAAEQKEKAKQEAGRRVALERFNDVPKAERLAARFGGGEAGLKDARDYLAFMRGEGNTLPSRPPVLGQSPSVQVNQGDAAGAAATGPSRPQ